MPKQPTGFAKALPKEEYLLRYDLMGDFKNNWASSCNTGVFVDRGQEDDQGNARQASSYQPRDFSHSAQFLASPADLLSRSAYELSNFGEPVYAVFEALTAFKNKRNGFWSR
jgi:hypothetical protein